MDKKTVSSTNTPMELQSQREVKKNRIFKSKKILLVLIGIIGILILSFWPKLFGQLTGKIDDWQFKPSLSQSGFPNPLLILSSLTPESGLILVLFFLLYTAVPVFVLLFLYRFTGFVWRRFRPQSTFAKTRISRFLVPSFCLGATGVAATIIVIIKFPSLMMPVGIALALATLEVVLLIPFSGLYFVINLIIWFIRRLRQQELFSLKRRFMYSLIVISSVLLLVIPAFILTLFSGAIGFNATSSFRLAPKALYTPSAGIPVSGGIGGGIPEFNSLRSDTIGYSTGGAKDINNFRVNIKNNFLPLPTDITHEGIFYDYYFDTGQQEPCAELFCPSYSYALSPDPFSKKPEYYLSVGLNSGIKQSDFQRKKLNLVIVMDISGSMGSPFDTYYYDQFGNYKPKENTKDANKSKIQIADESVVALLNHLKPGDRFGMVLFDDQAYLAKHMRLVEETDMNTLKNHILEIRSQGSTNMEAGIKTATQLFREYYSANRNEYENRIIFLTDAQPNTGDYSQEGLLGMTQTNAQNNIFMTFIGIGVDFNTELIDSITKIKGANYYSVHSSEEFSHRMDAGFDYMVTPLVFNLALNLKSDDFSIDKVYGSPEANLATQEIMRVNTLFPSENTNEGVKGGLVLLKLHPKKSNGPYNLKLSVTYQDRNDQTHTTEASANIPDSNAEYYANTGIRKGIVLSRYANLLINWALDERQTSQLNSVPEELKVNTENGIVIPPDLRMFTQWERTSKPLIVSSDYKTVFTDFKNYLASEKLVLNDNTLDQEINVLDLLINKPVD